VAQKAGIPDLHFVDFDEDLDHGWHEFAALEHTSDLPSDGAGREINHFIAELKFAR